MSQGNEHKEQAFAAVACTFIANICGQPGVALIFRDSSILVGAILTALAGFAIVVHYHWPQLESKIINSSVYRPLNFFRRRFVLVVICVTVSSIPIVLTRMWPAAASPRTRLVIEFSDASPDPRETGSSNVHWQYWSGIEAQDGITRSRYDNILNAQDIPVYAHEVAILFLRFDAPLDFQRMTITMADWSAVPDATTYRKDERTAVLVIRGRIKRGVEMTIEPGPTVARRI